MSSQLGSLAWYERNMLLYSLMSFLIPLVMISFILMIGSLSGLSSSGTSTGFNASFDQRSMGNVDPADTLAYYDTESEDYALDLDEEYLPGPDEAVAIDIPARLLSGPSPAFPLKALQTYTEGEVWVKVLVDTEGDVQRAIIEQESGSDVGFEEAAIKAAMLRKYDPAFYEYQPVACWVSYRVEFKFRRQ